MLKERNKQANTVLIKSVTKTGYFIHLSGISGGQPSPCYAFSTLYSISHTIKQEKEKYVSRYQDGKKHF